MSDQPGSEPQGTPQPQQQIQIQVGDEQKHGDYANFLVVSHSPHEFTLDFCQLQPSGEANKVNAEVISRVRIAPTLVGKVIQALNTNLSGYEEKYGQVKAF